MKLFKKLALLVTSLTLCVGVGSAIVACGGDKDSETNEDGYQFLIVHEDDSPATGYKIQLCQMLEDGTLGMCWAPVAADENGKVSYNPTGFDMSMEYEIHVMEGGVQIHNFESSIDVIPANYDGDVITVTILAE